MSVSLCPPVALSSVLALLSLVTAGPDAIFAQQSHRPQLAASAAAKLDLEAQHLKEQGYQETQLKFLGRLASSGRRSFSVELLSGVGNAIVVTCDQNCGKFEVAVYDRERRPLARNAQNQDSFITIGNPHQSGPHEVEIAVPGCGAAECEIGLLVLRQESISGVGSGAGYQTYDNRDIDGTDLLDKPLRNVDEKACVSACRANIKCLAYSFDKWNRYCFLKFELRVLRLDPRSVTGIRADLAAPPAAMSRTTMPRYRSKAFPGSGYKTVSVAGFEACESTCAAEDACVAYTFKKSGRSCDLFETTGEYFGDRNADSGAKVQEVEEASRSPQPAAGDTPAADPGPGNDSPVAGQWRWRADCGLGGRWHGVFRLSPTSGDRFEGVMTSNIADSGPTKGCSTPLKISNGRINGDKVYFERESCTGSKPMQWNGTLAGVSSESPRMAGSMTSTRPLPYIDRWTCSWSASR